jgi:hypothetical protein
VTRPLPIPDIRNEFQFRRERPDLREYFSNCGLYDLRVLWRTHEPIDDASNDQFFAKVQHSKLPLRKIRQKIE